MQQLVDEAEVGRVLTRYTAALDAKDWDLLASCFAPSPVYVHPGGRLEGLPAVVARCAAALDPLDATQHLLLNVVVDVDGDTARASSSFSAQHVRAGRTYVIAGSYRDRLVRTADGWRIAERVQAYAWRDGDRSVVSR